MTTQTVVSLEELMGALGAKTPIPSFQAADLLVRPLDIGRSYIADILCSIVDCDASNAFSSISWPNNIYNGDLVVILPRLSHGSDAESLARSIMQKVCLPCSMRNSCQWRVCMY
jgi:arginyl-tRNA synthetase